MLCDVNRLCSVLSIVNCIYELFYFGFSFFVRSCFIVFCFFCCRLKSELNDRKK